MRKVAVIMPAYNCAETVKESALSVLEGNKESVSQLVFVDDKSKDITLEILRALEKDYPIVKIICHEENLGGASARNTAVSYCDNEYIFCLDSDNILMPGSLSQLIQFAGDNHVDVAAFREVHYFSDSIANVTHFWRFPVGHFSLSDYLAGVVVPGASGNYLFKKSAWEDVGGYRVKSSCLDSWVFGLDLLANGKKMAVMDKLFYYHRYGLESYWVRESAINNMSLLAADLMSIYLDRLSEESKIRLINNKHNWFNQLDAFPLILKQELVGQSGLSHNVSLRRKFRYFINSFFSINEK